MRRLAFVSISSLLLLISRNGNSRIGFAANENTFADTPQVINVIMDHDNFEPAVITIKVNESITWKNKDLMFHTVTSDEDIWDSGKIITGGIFTHQFTKPGTYNYHCKIHDKMKAQVIVK